MRPAVGPLLALAVSACLTLAITACGDDSGGDDGGYPQGTSEAAVRGRELIVRSGCVACHSGDGSTKSGPTWQGLAGSEVALADGRTVVAEDAYLSTAIADPKAELRAGYPALMPEYLDMTPAQIADIVAYLHELGEG